MNISSLPRMPGKRKGRRIGRGPGSGRGNSATRGQKGQGARTGSRKRPGFEGGRNPLIRALPKRGFVRKERGYEQPRAIVNIGQLGRCKEGDRVTAESLKSLGLIDNVEASIKLLGNGEISKKLTVVVQKASAGAKSAIERADGKVELVCPGNTKRS